MTTSGPHMHPHINIHALRLYPHLHIPSDREEEMGVPEYPLPLQMGLRIF